VTARGRAHPDESQADWWSAAGQTVGERK
jgi:hypothetical protein